MFKTKFKQSIPYISLKIRAALCNLFQKQNRRRIYGALLGSAAGSYVYQQFINNNLEVIYTPNEYNNALIESIESISSGKYWGSPSLFIRCMEIIYGNTMDTRAFTEYEREIIFAPDNENLALGNLTRLAK